jgi:hypothetical protein
MILMSKGYYRYGDVLQLFNQYITQSTNHQITQ